VLLDINEPPVFSGVDMIYESGRGGKKIKRQLNERGK